MKLNLSLTGAAGGQDLALGLQNSGNPYGTTWLVSFGQGEPEAVQVPKPMHVVVRVEREKQLFRVFLNDSLVTAYRSEHGGNFEELVIDFFDRNIGIQSLSIKHQP